jgi:hypothetical protein
MALVSNLRTSFASPITLNASNYFLHYELGEVWVWHKVYNASLMNTPGKGARDLALINVPEIDRDSMSGVLWRGAGEVKV